MNINCCQLREPRKRRGFIFICCKSFLFGSHWTTRTETRRSLLALPQGAMKQKRIFTRTRQNTEGLFSEINFLFRKSTDLWSLWISVTKLWRFSQAFPIQWRPQNDDVCVHGYTPRQHKTSLFRGGVRSWGLLPRGTPSRSVVRIQSSGTSSRCD